MEAKKSASEFSLGKKEDSVTKPLFPQPTIHDNPIESEIIISDAEHITDLRGSATPASAASKRAEFNAGAMSRNEVENAKMLDQAVINALTSEEQL